jgi:hypothetical protein
MSFVSMATMRSSKVDAALVQLAFDQLIELHDIEVRSHSIAEPLAIV